ncbi:type IV secretory system conjugative DNA transfer family protein [Asaia spathodeae]|uniref:Type IV secretory system conjugative DNA transfer family protein n=2 Tax=Asaia spathodeae TaxID=657016 RepID=A0ABX2P8F2_9PROT
MQRGEPAKTKKTGLRQLLLLTAMGLGVIAINGAATHYVAERFGRDPSYLGPSGAGGFYAPLSWLGWQLRLGVYNKPLFYMLDWCVFGGVAFTLIIGLGAMMSAGRRKAAPIEGLHGTAKFSETEDEIKAAGLLLPEAAASNAVTVGGWTDPTGRLRYLRHEGPEHVMVVAPTRSGKGVGLIVPTLLSWTRSAVVHDIKGELWAMTSGWRQKHAKNIVLKFDPASPEGSCGYNILSEVRLNTPYEVGDTQNLVTIIVDPDGKGIEGDHWASSAHSLLVGLILYRLRLASSEGQEVPSLFDIGWSLSDPTKKDRELWDEMLAYRLPGTDQIDPVIGQTARDMIGLIERGEEEYTSVMSTTKRFLNIYRDPIIRKNISSSDFKMWDIVNSEKPVTLYFVIRPSDKERLRPLVRLMMNQIMRVLTRDPLTFDSSNQPIRPHKHRLLMMMDEFPSFKKLEVFEESMAFVAGYGIKCYVVIQDFNQLWKEYTDNEAITSNCHVRVVYAPNRQETADEISAMTGTMTVVAEDISESGKQFGMTDSVSRSYQNVSRPLMTPHEVSTMKSPKKDSRDMITEAGDMLVFVAGHNVIYGTQPLYFQDATFLARAKVSPPRTTDRIQSSQIAMSVGQNVPVLPSTYRVPV